MSVIEDLKEKTWGFRFRIVVRFMALVVLGFYMVFRICIPVAVKERVILDSNDGWVISICMILILSIQAAKALADWYAKKKIGAN